MDSERLKQIYERFKENKKKEEERVVVSYVGREILKDTGIKISKVVDGVACLLEDFCRRCEDTYDWGSFTCQDCGTKCYEWDCICHIYHVYHEYIPEEATERE